MSKLRNRSRGYSLIELMIAVVVGLIVIGAVLTFTVSTVRAYSENIRSTRLTQDLRNGMNVVVRELRRAGFDSTSVTRVLTGSNPSTFNAVSVDGQCVIYRYDRGVGGGGGTPGATEVRGIRRNATTGALQMNATSSSIDCAGSAGWVDVSDPNVVNITAFSPSIRTCPFCVTLATRTVSGVDVYDIAQGSTRNLALSLTGSLRADSSVVRVMDDSVRIRAEDVSFVTGSATNCPATQTCSLP